MKPILTFASGLSLVFLLSAQLVSQSNTQHCRNTADCNIRGTALLKAGNISGAIDDFSQELRDAGEPQAVMLAFNNLSVAYLRRRDFLQARFWAQQALALDANGAAATHNLEEINAHLGSFSWPKSPDGTYLYYLDCDWSNEIRISESNNSRAKLWFQGVRIGANGCHSAPAAVGEIDGAVLVLQGKSAIYKGSGQFASCRIELKIAPDSLSVEEVGECGFGAGVHTTGEYQRVSVR